MKRRNSIRKYRIMTALSLALCMVTAAFAFAGTVLADNDRIVDTNPAIYVAQKTSGSVVGVITSAETWNQSTRSSSSSPISQGSGVVIKEGGYIITNYHVVENGNKFEILLPSGTKAEAQLVGTDQSTDIAILQCASDELTPVAIGSSSTMPVGSTVIAIGNPGGEVLANTVTSGIISALERAVDAKNSTRVNYIQHDAPINSGNSGGGLFNVNAELIGINTLKYSGSVYSSVSFEGLGFAIPIDTVYPLAEEIIEYGSVRRPQMGITIAEFDGPQEPMNNYPPASIAIYEVLDSSPAEAAGLQKYDFIYEINGVRVTTLRTLMTEIDKFDAGDTVTLTILRYANAASFLEGSTDSMYGFYNPFGGRRGSRATSGYETLTIEVKLELPE